MTLEADYPASRSTETRRSIADAESGKGDNLSGAESIINGPDTDFRDREAAVRACLRFIEQSNGIKFPREFVEMHARGPMWEDDGDAIQRQFPYFDTKFKSIETAGVFFSECIDAFPIPVRSEDDFESRALDWADVSKLARDIQDPLDWLPSRIHLIARDGGETMFAFDYRDPNVGDQPPVVVIVGEYGSDDPEYEDHSIMPGASSFADFISAFVSDEEADKIYEMKAAAAQEQRDEISRAFIEDISAVEDRVGVRFPQEFVDLHMSDELGNYLGTMVFPFYDPDLRRHEATALEFLKFDAGIGLAHTINVVGAECAGIPEGVVPFAIGEGNRVFAFDGRKGQHREPSVVMVSVTDAYVTSILPRKEIRCAETFREFVASFKGVAMVLAEDEISGVPYRFGLESYR